MDIEDLSQYQRPQRSKFEIACIIVYDDDAALLEANKDLILADLLNFPHNVHKYQNSFIWLLQNLPDKSMNITMDDILIYHKLSEEQRVIFIKKLKSGQLFKIPLYYKQYDDVFRANGINIEYSIFYYNNNAGDDLALRNLYNGNNDHALSSCDVDKELMTELFEYYINKYISERSHGVPHENFRKTYLIEHLSRRFMNIYNAKKYACYESRGMSDMIKINTEDKMWLVTLLTQNDIYFEYNACGICVYFERVDDLLALKLQNVTYDIEMHGHYEENIVDLKSYLESYIENVKNIRTIVEKLLVDKEYFINNKLHPYIAVILSQLISIYASVKKLKHNGHTCGKHELIEFDDGKYTIEIHTSCSWSDQTNDRIVIKKL